MPEDQHKIYIIAGKCDSSENTEARALQLATAEEIAKFYF